MENPQTKIGVGVMVWKDGKVLMCKRKGSHGSGQYSFPGGHLEYMEGIVDCAKRETFEEAGIEIENLKFQYVYNMKTYAPKHYLHIGVIADWKSGEPKIIEPDKCDGWEWLDPNNLPENLFDGCKKAFEVLKSGANFVD